MQKTTPHPQWYVVYCASRTEKKTHQLLVKQGITAYLPLITEVRQWSDRKKKVEVPLLKGYVFVYIMPAQFTAVRMITGVVNFVYYNHRPAIVKCSEIETLKQLVTSGMALHTQAAMFTTGDLVSVIEGPLKGLQGTWIKKAKSHKFLIQLEAINQMIWVELPVSAVQVVKGKPAL